MKNELVIKKCLKCGKVVKVMTDCDLNDCIIKCCDEEMILLKANTENAAAEKHLPTYEKKGDILEVKVNHVMDEEHFIEWICLKTEDREEFVYLNDKEEAVATFKDAKSGTLYSYCNKHGLWSTKIGE